MPRTIAGFRRALTAAGCGAAAIALSQRYNMDSRDGGQDERAGVVFSNEGIWECTLVGECTEVCPKHVDPAGAIQQAKIAATKDYFQKFLMPRVPAKAKAKVEAK